MAEVDVHFQDITAAPSLDGMCSFVGVRNNGDTTYTDYRFTPAQIVAWVLGQARKVITALTANISTTAYANDTLTNPYFANAITTITYGGQTYQITTDFTQNTTTQTITWTNSNTFANLQQLIFAQ